MVDTDVSKARLPAQFALKRTAGGIFIRCETTLWLVGVPVVEARLASGLHV